MDSPDLYRELGATIRRRRRALELTQEQLAGRVGISRGALANIEAGRQQVLLHQVYRFAVALEVNQVRELMPILPVLEAPATPPKGLPLPKGLSEKERT